MPGKLRSGQWEVLSRAWHLWQPARAIEVFATDVAMTRRVEAGEVKARSALSFATLGGRVAGDLISCVGAGMLVSPRLLDVLERVDATGYGTYGVEFDDGRQAAKLAGHRGLIVYGRAGAKDDTRQVVALRGSHLPVGQPVPARLGFYFEDDAWDGSSVFRSAGGGGVFVTQELAYELFKAKVDRLEMLAAMNWDEPEYERIPERRAGSR